MLTGKENQQQAPAPIPQPATVQDTIALSREAREAAKETAELARQQAEEERQRRQEAEERAATAYEAGKQEAQTVFSTMLQMVQTFAQTAQENVRSAYEAQLALKEEMHKAQLQAVQAQIESLKELFKMQIEQKDQKINELTNKLNAISGRKSWEEWLAEQIASGNLAELRAKLGTILGTTGATAKEEDPEKIFQRHLADRLPEVIVAQKVKELEIQEEEARRKAEVHEAVKGLINTATSAVQEAKHVLPRILGGSVRRPDSVVPTAWPGTTVAQPNGHMSVPRPSPVVQNGQLQAVASDEEASG